MHLDDWQKTIEIYDRVKGLYIECEETDPELKTNLQPLNEFRLALDHVFRLINIEIKMGKGDVTQLCKDNFQEEYIELKNHLNRAFFDVCDLLCMNYRNKIVSALENFSPTVISQAYPDYYPRIRPLIEQISSNIMGYRGKKGTDAVTDIMESYYNDTIQLRDTYTNITTIYPTLVHLNGREKQSIIKNNKLGWIIGIAGIIIGALLAFIL